MCIRDSHETAAAGIKGQAGSIRVGGGGKRLHAGKTADAQRADAAFGTAADHGSLVTVPDAVEGIAHSIGAAGAGRDRAGAHALQAKTDGHLCRRHVGNGHRHKVGADLLHAFFFPAGVLLLDCLLYTSDVYKRQTMKKMGIEATFVDPLCTEEELNAAFRPNTKAVSYTHLCAAVQ